MKKSPYLLTFGLALAYLLSGCSTPPVSDNSLQLFNGENLSNWDLHLGSSLGSDFDEIAAAATVEQVYQVVEEGGEKLIRISGEINGALATRESYENYHMRLEFKWGETVYSRRNSGLLYHSFGPFGASFGTWMANIELQLMHDNLGDTYLMNNTTTETAVVYNDETEQYYYTPGAEVVQFGDHASGRMIRKASDQEKPLGEWNIVELYTVGRTAVHVVNGTTVMVNENTGTYQDGVITPLTGGKIQIQSEGAELFIRSITLTPITEIPAHLLP